LNGLLQHGVLLTPSSVGFVNDKKSGVVEFATFSSQWEARACAALANKKQDN
jgi:hypothetical protein